MPNEIGRATRRVLDVLPEWVVNLIVERRAKYEKKFNNDRSSPEYLKAVELTWILSLRKGDED